jgi:hypothetical protein
MPRSGLRWVGPRGTAPPAQRLVSGSGPQHAVGLEDHAASSIGAPSGLPRRHGSRLCTFGGAEVPA